MNTVRDLSKHFNCLFCRRRFNFKMRLQSNRNCSLVSGAVPSGVLVGQSPKMFWLFNFLGAIKWHKMALKTISWPKKLYIPVHKQFFLANIATPCRV